MGHEKDALFPLATCNAAPLVASGGTDKLLLLWDLRDIQDGLLAKRDKDGERTTTELQHRLVQATRCLQAAWVVDLALHSCCSDEYKGLLCGNAVMAACWAPQLNPPAAGRGRGDLQCYCSHWGAVVHEQQWHVYRTQSPGGSVDEHYSARQWYLQDQRNRIAVANCIASCQSYANVQQQHGCCSHCMVLLTVMLALLPAAAACRQKLKGHKKTVEDLVFQPGSTSHLVSVGDDAQVGAASGPVIGDGCLICY